MNLGAGVTRLLRTTLAGVIEQRCSLDLNQGPPVKLAIVSTAYERPGQVVRQPMRINPKNFTVGDGLRLSIKSAWLARPRPVFIQALA